MLKHKANHLCFYLLFPRLVNRGTKVIQIFIVHIELRKFFSNNYSFPCR